MFSVKLEACATPRSSRLVWAELEQGAPMRKLRLLPQELGLMLGNRQPLWRNSVAPSLRDKKSNLTECKWLMVGRRSLGWQRDPKPQKYENRKVDGLMWATCPPSKAWRLCLEELLPPVGCCHGADGATRPTDSASVAICRNAEWSPEGVQC